MFEPYDRTAWLTSHRIEPSRRTDRICVSTFDTKYKIQTAFEVQMFGRDLRTRRVFAWHETALNEKRWNIKTRFVALIYTSFWMRHLSASIAANDSKIVGSLYLIQGGLEGNLCCAPISLNENPTVPLQFLRNFHTSGFSKRFDCLMG